MTTRQLAKAVGVTQAAVVDAVSRVKYSMALEDQSTGPEHLEREIAELRRKLMEGKRSRLWQCGSEIEYAPGAADAGDCQPLLNFLDNA